MTAPKGVLTREVRQTICESKCITLALLDNAQPADVSGWARKASAFLSLIPDNEKRAGMRYRF